MANVNIEALLPLLKAAIEANGEEVAQTALQASPQHLLYEASKMAILAVDHVDDETGDEDPVAPEMAARAALLALVAAVLVAEARKRQKGGKA
jgi:hypothetical protein